MILIEKKIIDGIDACKTLEDLHPFIQKAIELEHSTIPPYLTAELSIGADDNQDIAEVIQNIVIEEMLHLTIACNILNAIGGSPKIYYDKDGNYYKEFLPIYPNKLPMNIHENLEINLEKFSRDVVKNTFMEIEAPEDRIPYPKSKSLEEYATIGLFYRAIQAKIKDILPNQDTKLPGNVDLQVTHKYYGDDSFKIIKQEDAIKGIDIIVDQGEGTNVRNNHLGKLAHYYLFEDLYYKTGDGKIPFDPSKIFNLKTNTKISHLLEGSDQKKKSIEFNRKYSELLKGLHETFNGKPENLSITISIMKKLRRIGLELVKMQFLTTEFTIGPSFEFFEL